MSTTDKPEQIFPQKCPICGIVTENIHRIKDSVSGGVSTWFNCNCGVTFQKDKPSGKLYN